LHAAAEAGYQGPGAQWPAHYLPGRTPPPGRGRDRVRPGSAAPFDPEPEIHSRWRPADRSAGELVTR
jgi:anthraniloyl-CoA monooxygenase